jgi:hypothetical protein
MQRTDDQVCAGAGALQIGCGAVSSATGRQPPSAGADDDDKQAAPWSRGRRKGESRARAPSPLAVTAVRCGPWTDWSGPHGGTERAHRHRHRHRSTSTPIPTPTTSTTSTYPHARTRWGGRQAGRRASRRRACDATLAWAAAGNALEGSVCAIVRASQSDPGQWSPAQRSGNSAPDGRPPAASQSVCSARGEGVTGGLAADGSACGLNGEGDEKRGPRHALPSHPLRVERESR